MFFITTRNQKRNIKAHTTDNLHNPSLTIDALLVSEGVLEANVPVLDSVWAAVILAPPLELPVTPAADTVLATPFAVHVKTFPLTGVLISPSPFVSNNPNVPFFGNFSGP